MNSNETRPSIRYLLFGPMTQSAVFWVEIGLILDAIINMGDIGLRLRQSETYAPITRGIFVFLVFVLVSGLYIYFADLAKLKAQAQAETDLTKLRMLCEQADFRFRVFCGAMGTLVVALTIWN